MSIAQCQQTKRALVQELFVKNGSQIKGFILSLLPDFGLVDDVLHEVFLVIVDKAESFQEGTSFLAWAYAIARLKVLEATRSKKNQTLCLSPEVIDALCASVSDEPSELLMEFKLSTLNDCMKQLAPRARTIVEMRYRQECRPTEIAKRLSWTMESVHVALSKARVTLRECIERKLAISGGA